MEALFTSFCFDAVVSFCELVHDQVRPADAATTAAYISFFFMFYSFKEKCRYYPALQTVEKALDESLGL
jgi:hypothetical protein